MKKEQRARIILNMIHEVVRLENSRKEDRRRALEIPSWRETYSP
jgi:hypothetical protein